MTLDALLALAQEEIADPPAYTHMGTEERLGRSAERADKLARAVIDLLGESLPCGYETPAIRNDLVDIPLLWHGVAYPSEARALAASLLRAADEAEKGASR